MEDLFPKYLTNQNFFMFLTQLVFVLLVFIGQVVFYQKFRGVRKTGVLFVEAFLFVPFFLFPVNLFMYWIGFGNQWFFVLQGIFILTALFYLKNAISTVGIRKKLSELGWLEWVLYVFVVVLGYFAWMVPIPEAYNGHAHLILNGLMRMLDTNQFYLLEKLNVSHENQIFIWPQQLVFSLRHYCFGHELFMYRPVFLVPAIVGFLLIHLSKDLCRSLELPVEVGFLGLLAVIGTYYNSLIFFEIQYDSYSLLLLVYFIFLLSRVIIAKDLQFANIFIILCMTLLIRKQTFAIIFFSTLAMLVFYGKNVRQWNIKADAKWLALGVLPLLLWGSLMYGKYLSPFYPQEFSFSHKVFPHKFHFKVTDYIDQLPLEQVKEEGSASASYGVRIQYFADFFERNFPFVDIRFLIDRVGFLFLFAIRAGPLSLLLTGIFVLMLLQKGFRADRREFLRIWGIYLIGYILAYLLVLKGYDRKYPQYLTAATLLPAGMALYQIKEKYRRFIAGGIALALFVCFYITLFGHRNVGLSSETCMILFGKRNFMQKIAFKSNKNLSLIEKEVGELAEASDSDKRILYMEHEPGLLLPSLLGREHLAEGYYLENYYSLDIMLAKDRETLRQALRRRNIGYIAIPERSHGLMERHPVIIALRKIKESGAWSYVVPVAEIVKAVDYGEA